MDLSIWLAIILPFSGNFSPPVFLSWACSAWRKTAEFVANVTSDRLLWGNKNLAIVHPCLTSAFCFVDNLHLESLEAFKTTVSWDNCFTNATTALTRLLAFASTISFFSSFSLPCAILPLIAEAARIFSWWSLSVEQRFAIATSSNFTSACRQCCQIWLQVFPCVDPLTLCCYVMYSEARWSSPFTCVFL